jgi:hypothetical protein
MAESFPRPEPASEAWSTDSLVIREFGRPVCVSDAVIETITEAVEKWPELTDSPAVFEFVDADKLDDLFKKRAVDDSSHIPSVEFRFQDAIVTVLYGSTVRVIVEQDT